jgi:hypothetical protein
LILFHFTQKKSLTGGGALLYEPLPARALPRGFF